VRCDVKCEVQRYGVVPQIRDRIEVSIPEISCVSWCHVSGF
jgi:hypothetical protein